MTCRAQIGAFHLEVQLRLDLDGSGVVVEEMKKTPVGS